MKKFLKSAFKITILFLFLAGTCGIFTPSAEGVPAMPGVWTHVQSDGSVIHYQVRGDEFLNYMIDPDGNLVAFGDDGDLYYADWISEEEFQAALLSDGSPVIRNFRRLTPPTNIKPARNFAPFSAIPPSESEMRPLRSPIPEFLLEHARNLRAERDRSWREQFENVPGGEFAPPQFTGGTIERNVLIIYVSFADHGNVPSMTGLPIPSAETLYNLIFGNNFGAVAHYFNTMTNGAAIVRPAATIGPGRDGIIFVQLPGRHGNWNLDIPSNFMRFVNELVIPALQQAANPANPGGHVNYSVFDTNRDGTITADELSIGFIVHGYETSAGGWNPAFPSTWGHAAWTTGPAAIATVNNVRIQRYFAQGAYHSRTQNPRLLTMGILAHELGHSAFGFIDLYDVDYGAGHNGIGMWSLMDSGSWGGSPPGSVPTALDAFHLYGGAGTQLVAPRAIVPGTNTLTGISQFAKLETPDPRQYFLIQPRGNVGYDQGFMRTSLPSTWTPINSGLLFLLVDNNLTGSNSLTANRHYRVAVVEALWNNPAAPYNLTTPRGSPNNLFSDATRTFINNDSMPSTKIYASPTRDQVIPTVPSGWDIHSISSSVSGAATNTGTVTGSFTVTATPGTATLRVTFQGRPVSGPANEEELRVIWARGGFAITEEEIVRTNRDGEALITLPQENNGLSIWVKGERTLGVLWELGTVVPGSVIAVGRTLPGGDANGENEVDLNDLSIFVNNYGRSSSSPAFNRLADFNNDGEIDLNDLSILISNYGRSGDPQPARQ